MKVILILLLLMVFDSPAALACTISNLILSSSSLNLTVNSSPDFEVRVVAGSIDTGCDFFITVDNGTSGGIASSSQRALIQNSDRMPLQIYSDLGRSAVIKDFPEVNSNSDVLLGHFAPGESPIKVMYIRPVILPLGYYARYGQYENTFTIKTYLGTPGSATYQWQRSVTMFYNQARHIDLSLVESGGIFNVNDATQNIHFGNMQSGDSRSFDVLVNYNAGYDLKFSSLNNGLMKHTSLAASIPYQLSVNGSVINLSNSATFPVSVSTGVWAAPAGGVRLPVQIQVGTLGQVPPGNYQDQIVMTVSSTD